MNFKCLLDLITVNNSQFASFRQIFSNRKPLRSKFEGERTDDGAKYKALSRVFFFSPSLLLLLLLLGLHILTQIPWNSTLGGLLAAVTGTAGTWREAVITTFLSLSLRRAGLCLRSRTALYRHSHTCGK